MRNILTDISSQRHHNYSSWSSEPGSSFKIFWLRKLSSLSSELTTVQVFIKGRVRNYNNSWHLTVSTTFFKVEENQSLILSATDSLLLQSYEKSGLKWNITKDHILIFDWLKSNKYIRIDPRNRSEKIFSFT